MDQGIRRLLYVCVGQTRYRELEDGTASTCYEVPGGASEALRIEEDDDVAEWRGEANLKEASDSITRLFCKRCLVGGQRQTREERRAIPEME